MDVSMHHKITEVRVMCCYWYRQKWWNVSLLVSQHSFSVVGEKSSPVWASSLGR